jgi:hypothetical protein
MIAVLQSSRVIRPGHQFRQIKLSAPMMRVELERFAQVRHASSKISGTEVGQP